MEVFVIQPSLLRFRAACNVSKFRKHVDQLVVTLADVNYDRIKLYIQAVNFKYDYVPFLCNVYLHSSMNRAFTTGATTSILLENRLDSESKARY